MCFVCVHEHYYTITWHAFVCIHVCSFMLAVDGYSINTCTVKVMESQVY